MSGADPSSAEGLKERYPHYDEYKKCQSKAFMTGSATLLGASACTYVVMDHWFQKFKPNISRNWLVAGPMMAGTVVAYVVTMTRSVHCQNMWMAMEERHSALTPAQERLNMRIQADQ